MIKYDNNKGIINVTYLQDKLQIKHPMIMAPMFLVSNVDMIMAAYQSGITGCLPAHNYRTAEEYKKALQFLHDNGVKFGVNIIVNKSNRNYDWQMDVTIEMGCDYIITSLGNPSDVIRRSHERGILVFCDVTNIEFATKVASLGADAIIAVGADAGGHAGDTKVVDLVSVLSEHVHIPIIAAGGVGDYASYRERLQTGACGVSVGTVFIACDECPVNPAYKQAIVDYGPDDIVLTSKFTGSKCTIINTDYVQKFGTEESWLEKFLHKHKKLKKWLRSLQFIRGMKMLEMAAVDAKHEQIWCAGTSVKYVDSIRPVAKIVKHIVTPS